MAEDRDDIDEGGGEDDPIETVAHAMGEPVADPREPGPVHLIRKLDNAIGVVELVAVAVFMVGLIVIATYKGISAKFMGEDPAWTKHLIWYGVWLIAMASAALSVQTSQMIKMDFVSRKVKPRTKLIMRMVTYLFAIFVLYFLIDQGWEARRGYISSDEFLDDRLIATSLPVTGAVIALHLILHTIIDGIYLAAGKTPREPDDPAVH